MYVPRLVTRACQTTNTTTGVGGGLDYSIPSGWKQITIDKSYPELNGVAQKAIDVLKSSYWPDPAKIKFDWQVGTTVSSIAYKDMVAGTKQNHDYVKAALQAAKNNNEHFDPFCFNDDAQWWGTAAMYAYRAYGDQEFLGWATDVWNWVAPSQITPEQAASGTTPVRLTPFKGQCNGKSTAGGVWWRAECSEKTDMDVNVITTSLFETLSAYLAEATKDPKYVEAAKNAYEFVMAHLMKEDPNIPIDTLMMADCAVHDWIFTYNTGKFVEGATVLSRVSGDAKYKEQALKTVVDAVKKGKWNDEQGRITEGQGGDPKEGGTTRQFKSIFLRALTEVGRREYRNKELKALLKTYVNIQWDTITTTGTDGKGNYGVVWKGPFVPAWSGQANVIDALAAGVEFNWDR
ncbi:hypothetical protein AURDEDRAFT_154866, partial [Auricularia subglabra TFB-10046 SS5]